MKILLLNQAFHPDLVSSGQHASDLALALAAEGHEVSVISSRRGYDNPALLFPKRERWKGISIHRVGSTTFGKAHRWRRAVDFASSLLGYFAALMFFARQDITVALSSPPLIAFAGALFVRLRGGHLVCWTLDLNPAQAIAAGWLKERSVLSRLMRAQARFAYRTADQIVALDRYMADHIVRLGVSPQKIDVIPPWAHDEAVKYNEGGRRRFRDAHGLTDKYVVMYSGNHSPCHSLDTLLETALNLRSNSDIAFCFVGGGSKFGSVQDFAARHLLTNIICLPYRKLDELSASLSAADLQVVVMGNPYVGMVHPCKIYNILSLGIPLLYIGPSPSHITDLLPLAAVHNWAHLASHGDVPGVETAVLNAQRRSAVSSALERQVAAAFSQRSLTARLARVVASVTGPAPLKQMAAAATADDAFYQQRSR